MKTIKRFELRVKRDRLMEATSPYDTTLSEPRNVEQVTQALCHGLDHEIFLVFLLGPDNRIMGYVEVARGGVDFCTVDVRQIFRVAVLQGASGIIVAHNHPSGNLLPSDDDIKLTYRINEAGKLLGIPLLDHVIVSDKGHSSLKSMNLFWRHD